MRRFRRPSPWELRAGLAIGHPPPFASEFDQVIAAVKQIRPLLAGRSAHVIGAILADLAATWLAGHVVPGDPEKTQSLRQEILDMHIEGVRGLTVLAAKREEIE